MLLEAKIGKMEVTNLETRLGAPAFEENLDRNKRNKKRRPTRTPLSILIY